MSREPSTQANEKELTHLEEYIRNGGNAYQAALVAGYADSTARTDAPLWIRATREDSQKPYLWDLYQQHRTKRLSHLDVTEDRILDEYARLAFWDIAGLFDAKGRPKRIQDIDEDTRRAITGGVDVNEAGFIQRLAKIKMAEKKGALDSLARIKGMNQDKVHIEHSFSALLKEITDETSVDDLIKEPEDLDKLTFLPGDN